MDDSSAKSVVILGAGIAGLSSGWMLAQSGVDFLILEKQPYVGGLARSFIWHGFPCDFAAHRLFTNDQQVLRRLLDLVPMGRHIRRSRIYLNGRWMRDPLDVIELGLGLRPGERIRTAWDYVYRNRGLPDDNFENYVVRRYGRRLYDLFFRPYTEKLFGIAGSEISVSWARQKVRLANPIDALRTNTKTKFSYFYYPRRGGYGAIANRLYDEIADKVQLQATVTAIETDGGPIKRIVYEHAGRTQRVSVQAVISTLPLTLTSRMLGHPISMQYQKVDAVYLWINRPWVSDNHWTYFADEDVCINRLVEFKNMSGEGVPQATTVLCAEVTQRHDHVVSRVVNDLDRIGVIRRNEVLDSQVIREEFAYPVYTKSYESTLGAARQQLDRYDNLHLVGRAAEFQHREVDDNFAVAIERVKVIMDKLPSRVPAPIAPVTALQQPKVAALVHAVILSHNHFDDTDECLQSVLKLSYADLRVILVDNGSSDHTAERTRDRFRDVHVIETGSNLGVPAGYNVGFEHALRAGADYILLLNNDTVVDADMLALLVEAGDADPQAGILMPKVLYHGSDTRIWSIGGYRRAFPPATVMTDKRQAMVDVPRLIEFAPSCGLLIHRRAFEKAGLFDPGYLFWYDDWDFCERVRAHGLRIQYVPAARMWHKVSRTTGGPKSPLFWRTYAASAVRFHRRHGRPAWLSVPAHLAYIIARDLVWGRNLDRWQVFMQGIRDGLNRPLGDLPGI